MPRLSAGSGGGAAHSRPSGGERVFADGAGRLWSAAFTGQAIVFSCISDGRLTSRAIAVDLETLSDDVGDDTLRRWLDAAPRIGDLT